MGGLPRFIRGGYVRVCLLASGSKGNAIYIETGGTRLLVDAGLSARELTRRLAGIGVAAEDLDAILISHEHSDHLQGAGTMARRYRLPVIVSHVTARAAQRSLDKAELLEFEAGQSLTFRDLLLDPFPITHDAADPVGFLLEGREGRLGVATDLGVATRLVREKLRGSRSLVLEANHDEDLLLNGPYPWHLKQRIKSRHGHLSNADSMELLGELLHPGLEAVFLAHLSETNNDPVLPLTAARELLGGQNACAPRLIVGEQSRSSELLEI